MPLQELRAQPKVRPKDASVRWGSSLKLNFDSGACPSWVGVAVSSPHFLRRYQESNDRQKKDILGAFPALARVLAGMVDVPGELTGSGVVTATSFPPSLKKDTRWGPPALGTRREEGHLGQAERDPDPEASECGSDCGQGSMCWFGIMVAPAASLADAAYDDDSDSDDDGDGENARQLEPFPTEEAGGAIGDPAAEGEARSPSMARARSFLLESPARKWPKGARAFSRNDGGSNVHGEKAGLLDSFQGGAEGRWCGDEEENGDGAGGLRPIMRMKRSLLDSMTRPRGSG